MNVNKEKYIYLRVKVDITNIASKECTVNDIVTDCDYSFSFDGIELDTEIMDYE